MAQEGRTFRIFVSSTFTDLQEERNALQREVFPALKKLCTKHDSQFQAIDLRWGVGEEASLDQRTMKICLEELNRCQTTSPRPNFILLLGDRYGWRPLPEEIPADEFEEIEKHVKDDEDGKLLSSWYKKDENAIPSVYILQPRTDEFAAFKVWEPVEKRLRSIFLNAVSKMNLNPDALTKYITSATEQEIVNGALKVEDAKEHVFCFFREIENLPRDKSAKDYIDLKDDDKPDTEAKDLLDKLKKRLEENLPGNVYKYKARWTGSGITTDHIEKLCRDVYKSLEKIILSEIEQIETKSSLEKEEEAHQRFGEERAKVFIGRDSILKTINNYIKEKTSYPLAVYGEGGSGKSALAAFALGEARKNHPHAEIVFRFIGATPNSSDGRMLLEDLCRQISKIYGGEETLPTSYEDLVDEFPKRLALATSDKPLVLFLDSLDQLSEAYNARSLNWLPGEFPEHVRLIVTTRPGEYLVALRNKIPKDSVIELGPMSLDEGKKLLDRWLKDAGRDLQKFQKKEVLDKFSDCGLPLYLKLAFEEARLWKSYTKEIELNKGKEGIIKDNLFKRLKADHGRLLVSRSLGYIAATRGMNGLAEDELLDILSLDTEFFKDFEERAKHKPPEPKLPVVVWSRFYFDLEPYLGGRSHEGTSLLTFFHRELGEVATSQYLAEDEVKFQQVLADYFLRRADPEIDPKTKERKKTWQGTPRALSELPYHFTLARRWDELFEILIDFQFLEQKAARVGVQENIDAEGNKVISYTGANALIEDYDLALRDFPADNQ
jgi:NACHT domain- and WD repeat-containing protein